MYLTQDSDDSFVGKHGVRPEDRIAEMKRRSLTTGLGETFQYSNYLVAAGGYAAAHSYALDLDLGNSTLWPSTKTCSVNAIGHCEASDLVM
jgi:hypothetical protein